ncbi:MAG: hypothetical protein FWF59_06885 [Turicibacter sp.]|nr:hypothetical protein [Turicibacter sp.]
MRMIGWELRKIFEWKRVLAALVFCTLFFMLFLTFPLNTFHRNRPMIDNVRVTQSMIEKYGTALDDGEFADFVTFHEEKSRQFDEYLATREDVSALGFSTLAEIRNSDNESPEVFALLDTLYADFDEPWEIQAREHIIEFYEARRARGEAAVGDLSFWGLMLDANQAQRENTLGSLEAYPLFEGYLMANYSEALVQAAAMIAFSIVIIVSPLYLTERHQHMLPIQYASKLGRKLYAKKAIAVALAGAIIALVELSAVFAIYAIKNGTLVFSPVEINSFLSPFQTWFDFTFGQYMLVTALMALILGTGMALLSKAISRIAPIYLTLLAILVPILAGLIHGIYTYLLRSVWSFQFPQWFPFVIYGGIALVVGGIILWQGKHEKKCDILV